MSDVSDAAQSVPSQILVTGDVVREIYIYKGDRELPSQEGKIAPHLADNRGGAKALYELLRAARGSAVAWGLEDQPIKSIQSVHALWIPCDGRTKQERDEAGKSDKVPKVWRTSSPPLGYSLGQGRIGTLKGAKAAEAHHPVIIIDDAGLEFRTQPAAVAWPAGLKQPSLRPEWIIYKMEEPVAAGDLWRALTSRPDLRERLVVVLSAKTIRRAGAAVSLGYSWERTLTELCDELNRNPRFAPLLNCTRRLIINFDCVGAIWFDEASVGKDATFAQNRAILVYDPTLPEEGWKTCLADSHSVYGHLNTFTAAIALAAADGLLADSFGLNSAIERGLAACRYLRLKGHGSVMAPAPNPPLKNLAEILTSKPTKADWVKETKKSLLARGVQTIHGPSHLTDPQNNEVWTLAALAENPADQPDLPLYGLAHCVALRGLGELRSIPHDRFGALVSVDRKEIETLRSLTQLIDSYKDQKQPKQPLSVAAFGPPGAGKSFGIKEIAKKILSGDVPILEFNLSQFDNASDLHGALHQVRDHALKGSVPVVFWDEFDAREYKWLQYLLAPMQDGTFEQNGHTHTIGKCIFVFAGGTSWDYEHFGPAPMPQGSKDTENKAGAQSDPETSVKDSVALEKYYTNNPGRKELERSANEKFRLSKGPDFISRLDGHINVLGPNQRMLYNWEERAWTIRDPHDITFPVRRALLLRQFLGAKKPDDKLDIDRDLLRAFLQTPRYRHGARSLEKIARALGATSRPFRRAHLPPPQVLEQHLEPVEAFNEIYKANQDFHANDNLLRMAAAISDYYDRRYGAWKSPNGKNRTAEEAWKAFEKKLSDTDSWEQWDVATNMAAARRLPYILGLCGLGLCKGKATVEEQGRISKHLKQHLRRLAEEEHNLWMEFHFDNGWRQADEKKLAELKKLKDSNETAYKAEIKRLKKEDRIHTLLRPFDDIFEEQRKDFEAIEDYPSVVDLIGWKIVFIEH